MEGFFARLQGRIITPSKALSLINFVNILNPDQAKKNWALSGSILFDTLRVLLKDIFKTIFSKENSAEDNDDIKLPSI